MGNLKKKRRLKMNKHKRRSHKPYRGHVACFAESVWFKDPKKTGMDALNAHFRACVAIVRDHYLFLFTNRSAKTAYVLPSTVPGCTRYYSFTTNRKTPYLVRSRF